ncbi:MAG: bifunctional DNA-formamidopyrimidine glycosylase/DNA-(apurinic or apyrimidinic site) lyase [Acidimicrobiia bacterium]|nr:bifunctional DNA-formamidopyrimidine glycosylase/DNA-(apurinic or apyrimidinic site) lyase [Acidimicrobiia bacterium]
MPELPEVEITRRHLEPVVRGARVGEVAVRRARALRLQPHPGDFAVRLQGRRVLALTRQGKYLLGDLGDGLTWVTHLGMSGRMSLAGREEPEAPHTAVVVSLEAGPQVRFVDPRTFGHTAVLTADELAAAGPARLGPDALDALPRSPVLVARLAGRRAPIKPLLLDQRLLAGLGNIYADEVLHRARVRPDRPAGSLNREEVAALRRAVRPVLEASLRRGGTSLADLAYLLPDGRAGGYLERLAVYGRAGEPCRRCGGAVERMVLRGRSAYFCSGCQR